MDQFKKHPCTQLRLNHVRDRYTREQQSHTIIPMFFEYKVICEDATGEYRKTGYHPTEASMLYAICDYYGWDRDMIEACKDSYGDLLIKFDGAPSFTVWYQFKTPEEIAAIPESEKINWNKS